MANKTPNRAVARKLKDKWKAKQWYRVLAPDMYDRAPVAETMADEPDKLLGRVLEVTLQDLTGDFSKMHIKLNFKITDISGSDVNTIFIGHGLASDYLRRLTRRKRSKTAGVYDVTTKEGYKVRIKPLAITEHRIQTSQQKVIRTIMGEVVTKTASESMLSGFINEMVTGSISEKMIRACKPIYPLKNIEIARSQIMEFPSPERISAALAEEEKLRATMEPGASAEPSVDDEDAKPKKAKKVKKVKVAKVSDEVKALTALNGVGPSKAKLLFDAGLTTVEMVKAAREEVLVDIVGPSLTKKILS